MLLHKSSFRERSGTCDLVCLHSNGSSAVLSDGQRSGKVGQGNVDTSDVCNYCHEKGHWKADCAVLKAKLKGGRPGVNPAAVAVPVRDTCVSEVCVPQVCEPDVLEAHAPFI